MTVEKKSTDLPIRDFDTDSYDEVVPVQEEVVAEPPSSAIYNVDLEAADAKDLLLYFAARFKETQGYEYKVTWVKEIAILKSFKERYSTDAGPMIALLFDKYKCSLNGQVMTVTAFTQGAKWIQDKLYIELQEARIKNESKPSTEGLMRTDDFLKRFTA
jgi:hypothetical protein